VDEPTRCPYREICKCPGYDKDEGDWEPVEGFIRTKEGVLCLDWDIVIPLGDIPRVKIPEGRHITDAIEAADKIDAATRKYNKSPKRREAQRKYEAKKKGQAAIEKYQDSEKFKLGLQKYYFSSKGQEAHQRRGVVLKDYRKAAKWLADNPGKTYEDFLKGQASEG